MHRWLAGVVVGAGLVAAGQADLSACADKFLRIGRGLKFQRLYAAAYPASILLYAPERSVTARVTALPDLLKRSGHKPATARTPTELQQTLAAGRYDLVLADLSDIPAVKGQLEPLRASPAILPILLEPSRADLAAARAAHTCVITLPAVHRNDALIEIDHRMELRLKGAAAQQRQPADGLPDKTARAQGRDH